MAFKAFLQRLPAHWSRGAPWEPMGFPESHCWHKRWTMKGGAFRFSSFSVQFKPHLSSEASQTAQAMAPAPGGGASHLCLSQALGIHCLVSAFHSFETHLGCKVLEGRDHVYYMLCVRTGLRLVQSSWGQVMYSISRMFLLTPKAHTTNSPVALPKLLVSSHAFHHCLDLLLLSFPLFSVAQS